MITGVLDLTGDRRPDISERALSVDWSTAVARSFDVDFTSAIEGQRGRILLVVRGTWTSVLSAAVSTQTDDVMT